MFVRAVLPARIPQSTKLLAACVAVVGAGVAMAITCTHTFESSPRPPIHHWALDGNTADTHGFMNLVAASDAFTSKQPLELGAHFTISARVKWADHHTILSNGQVVLGKRENHFEVIAGGHVLSSGIQIREGKSTRVVVTRNRDELTLWVDGNPSRMLIEDEAKADAFYVSGMTDVTVWDFALSAEQIEATR